MEKNNLPAHMPEPQLPTSRFAFAEADDPYGDEKSGPGLKRYVSAVKRYKWLVLLLTMAGTAAGVFISRQVSLTYVAQGVLWFQTVTAQSERQGPIRSASTLLDNTRIELVHSASVLEPVVREQRLYVRYDTADADLLDVLSIDTVVQSGRYTLVVDARGREVELRSNGMVLERVPAGEPVGRQIGLVWTPPGPALRPGRETQFTVMNPPAAATSLAHQLNVNSPPRSNFMTVRYTNTNPVRAAAVVNSITRHFVEVATDLKRVHLIDERDELKEQLDIADANLQAASFALNDFLVRTATMPSQPSSPVTTGTEDRRADAMNTFFELKARRDQLIRDRDAIDRALQGGGTLSIDALSAVESAQQSPELSLALQDLTAKRAEVRELLQRFTLEHPQVVRANDAVMNLERVVIPQLARGVIAELNTRVAVTDGQVAAAAGELQDIPPRAISEAGFRREVASAENIYNELLQRYENARLTAETTQPDVSVMTPASIPQEPNSDLRFQMLLFGIAAGLGLGIGLAVLLELMDTRVRYAEQVSDGMHLTILGAIPDLSGRRKLFTAGPDKAELVEALRGIRLNLTHAYGSAGPLMVTITSPGPGDGKTFLTSNLATTFAELGMRTLIIDADTRRGTMHHVMKVSRKPGLTDYLSRKVELSDVIRSTPVRNLDMIPSGTRSAHAPELLSSPYMGDLLAYIRASYDAILIDSPPLGAGVDPLVLATATGNVVLLMRTGRTDRELAEAKLAILDRLPVRVLGAVLNGIGGETAYKYYSYLPGYEAGQEDADDSDRLLQPA